MSSSAYYLVLVFPRHQHEVQRSCYKAAQEIFASMIKAVQRQVREQKNSSVHPAGGLQELQGSCNYYCSTVQDTMSVLIYIDWLVINFLKQC